jgi:hypothetical protein
MKDDLYAIVPIKHTLPHLYPCARLRIASASGLMNFLDGQEG